MKSSQYQNLIAEGNGTFDVKTLVEINNEIEQNKVYSKILEEKETAWSLAHAAAKIELIALIGEARANRAQNHYQSWVDALEAAKNQIASGKCKAA